MSDLIRRKDVLEALKPIVNTLPLGYHSEFASAIFSIPSAEPKVGRWEQPHVYRIEDTTIDTLQSTYCPICHRYHTTPYIYSFNHYDYCPNCGAKMERRTDGTQP